MPLKKPRRSLLKQKVSARKAKEFSLEVDRLIAARKRLKNPNFGKSKLPGRKFSPNALKKVSNKKVSSFGKDLKLYREGGKKAPKFPGIHGTSGRGLSKKALSKVTDKQLKKFDKRKTK